MKNYEFEDLGNALVRHSSECGTAPSCIPCPRQGTEWITLVRSNINGRYRVLPTERTTFVKVLLDSCSRFPPTHCHPHDLSEAFDRTRKRKRQDDLCSYCVLREKCSPDSNSGGKWIRRSIKGGWKFFFAAHYPAENVKEDFVMQYKRSTILPSESKVASVMAHSIA